MAKHPASQLTILQWNICGLHLKQEEVRHLLNLHSADVALIQETLLKPEKSLFFPGFQKFRMDCLDNPGGGVLLLVKNSLSAH